MIGDTSAARRRMFQYALSRSEMSRLRVHRTYPMTHIVRRIFNAVPFPSPL
jgi:hypothetical protein